MSGLRNLFNFAMYFLLIFAASYVVIRVLLAVG